MLRFVGQAAHSGSTPIPMRRDAFLAAAETALACREIARRLHDARAPAWSARSARSRSSRESSPRCRACARSRSTSARSMPTCSRAMLADARAASRAAAADNNVAVEWRHALADRAAPVRSAADRAVRRGGARSHRRRAAAAVGSAARRGGDGAAHAGRDDVRVFVERPVALQGRGHAGAAPRDRRSSAFLRLVDKTVAHDRLTRVMALTPGVRLGPGNEIVAAIGTGGMGEVYRARDTRLNRTVAIKVLPQALSNDPTLRQRFEREARNYSPDHPHCGLFDIGIEDGRDYIVMQDPRGHHARLAARARRAAAGRGPEGRCADRGCPRRRASTRDRPS